MVKIKFRTTTEVQLSVSLPVADAEKEKKQIEDLLSSLDLLHRNPDIPDSST